MLIITLIDRLRPLSAYARGGGVGFHQNVIQMKLCSEPIFDHRRVPFAGIGARESTGSLEDVDRSTKPALGEQGSGNPALCRVRSLDALGRGAGIIDLCYSAGIATGQSHPLGDL